MPATNPRMLKEITEYRDLLNARDDALKVVNAILDMDQDTVNANLTATVTAVLKPKTPGPAIQSIHFNAYMAKWIKKNIRTMANQVIAIIDAEIASNLTEANQEAGLLGINASPVVPQAPSITSSLSENTELGAAYVYQATATHTTDPGITSVVWACDDLPSGAAIEANTGKITWNVPWDASTSAPTTFTVKVTTNAGTDSKQVSVTVAVPESVKPVITAGQTINAKVNNAMTDYPVQGTNVKVGQNHVTSAVWSCTDLPTGLTINADTGVISGTPDLGTDSSSPYTSNLKVVTNFGTATNTATVTVQV